MWVVNKLFRRKCCCCDVVEKKGEGWDGGKSAEQVPGTGWGETDKKESERATGQAALAVIG